MIRGLRRVKEQPDAGKTLAEAGEFLMYSRRIRVEYRHDGAFEPCPIKWLDNFAMRNFTNDPVFDDTLPIGDGVMEIGTRVPLDRLRDAMAEWFRKKSYVKKDTELTVKEIGN